MRATVPALVPTLVWTPKPGDLVLCTHRLASAIQWWLHPVQVGVVKEPGDDPAAWNARNSERDYCTATGRLPVEYMPPGQAGVRQHDGLDSLFPAPEGRTRPWMLKDEEEAWDLVFRSYAYASRHHRERTEAVELALAWGDGVGCPLSRFGTHRMVQDEGHRVGLLAAVEDCIRQYEAVASRRPPLPPERDVQLAALRQLRGIARHAPVGVELAARHPLAQS